MSSIYTGDDTAVSESLAATITDASNATPIVITTSAAHGYQTHDRVTIAGVVGNTAANGDFVITWLSASTFSLDGSTGNGAYVSGGTVVDNSLTPQFQIPSDGDGPIQASDVNPAFETLGDRTQFLIKKAQSEAATRAANDAAETAARNLILVPLADLATLAAIATPADGTVRHVLGFGFYTFKTSATTGFSPFRVAAADATVGGWVSSTAHEVTMDAYMHLADVPVTLSVVTGALAADTISANKGFAPGTVTQVLQNAAGVQMLVVNTSTLNWHIFVPLNRVLIDGATLDSATLFCRPRGTGATHAALPTRQIQMIIVRNAMTATGGLATSTPNPTHLSSAGGSGFASLAAASVAAYEADQQLVFTCDQNNVIDKSQYSYGAIIADEGGTNALPGSFFTQIKLSMSGIADARRG